MPAGRAAGVKRMVIERFPVSMLLGIQLLVMVIIPAVVKETEPLQLILRICAVALAVALYVEALILPLGPSDRVATPLAVSAARTILAVGIVAVIISNLGGAGSYAVQLGLAERSPFASAATPFTIWMLCGTALILWMYRNEQVDRRQAIGVVFLVCAVSLWEGIYRAILGSSAAFMMTVLVLAIFARLIRVRALIAALMLIPLLWPPIYEFRDSIRRGATGGMVQVSADAPMERLQLDAQMALIARLTPRPVGLEAPDLLTLVRIGVIPSILDSPDRPPLDTASRLSVALGGSATNSQSATMLGNIYVFEGWPGIVAFAVCVTLVMGFLLRRNNPWAFAGVGLIYWSAISFNASYPDVIPKVLQAIVAMFVAYFLARLITRNRRNGTAGDAAVR
jgi:hypothetical protein